MNNAKMEEQVRLLGMMQGYIDLTEELGIGKSYDVYLNKLTDITRDLYIRKDVQKNAEILVTTLKDLVIYLRALNSSDVNLISNYLLVAISYMKNETDESIYLTRLIRELEELVSTFK